MVCRPTQKEAEDDYRYAIIEQADWGAIDGMLAVKDITPEKVGAEEFRKKREYFASRAIGGYPFVGTPDHVAEEFATLSRSGVRGIAFSLINYLDELPYLRDELLPRLTRAGVRAPVHQVARCCRGRYLRRSACCCALLPLREGPLRLTRRHDLGEGWRSLVGRLTPHRA